MIPQIDPMTGLVTLVEPPQVVRRGGGTRGSSSGGIPQLSADPTAPAAESAWVLKTGGAATGGGLIKTAMGMGFIYPQTGGASSLTYQLSYRTSEGTTKRVTLS